MQAVKRVITAVPLAHRCIIENMVKTKCLKCSRLSEKTVPILQSYCSLDVTLSTQKTIQFQKEIIPSTTFTISWQMRIRFQPKRSTLMLASFPRELEL